MGIICLEVPFERNPIKLDNIRAYNELRKIKKSIHFDLIHTHTPVVSFLVRLAYRRNKNTKVIYTSHCFHFCKAAGEIVILSVRLRADEAIAAPGFEAGFTGYGTTGYHIYG